MNENSTPSILQRVPVILAVTAASYGLRERTHAGRTDSATAAHKTAGTGNPMAMRDRANAEALALQD